MRAKSYDALKESWSPLISFLHEKQGLSYLNAYRQEWPPPLNHIKTRSDRSPRRLGYQPMIGIALTTITLIPQLNLDTRHFTFPIASNPLKDRERNQSDRDQIATSAVVATFNAGHGYFVIT